MTFQHIWDPLLIGPFLWLAGMAGMGSVGYVLLKWAGVLERRREISAVLLLSIALALVFVVADLSRPWNLPNAMLNAIFGGTFGITRSWMSVGIALLSLHSLLLLALVLRSWTGMLRIADTKAFDVALAAVGVAVTIYSGFLIAAAPGVPFWNTALLPVLWIISASVCAVALVKLLIHHETASKLATKYGIALELAELIAVFALVNLALYGGSRAARLSAEALVSGDLSAAFWIGVVAAGILLPMAASIYLLRREDKRLAAAAALLSLAGALLLRILVLQAGVFEPPV